MAAWALLVLGILPQDTVARETVDLIEVNHFYDEHGRLVFDQTIFYDWDYCCERYQVRAWRLIKNPDQIPRADWEHGGYVTLWQDGEVLRQVRARETRESWTQYDPELTEREWLPKEARKELKTVRVDRAKRACPPAANAAASHSR